MVLKALCGNLLLVLSQVVDKVIFTALFGKREAYNKPFGMNNQGVGADKFLVKHPKDLFRVDTMSKNSTNFNLTAI